MELQSSRKTYVALGGNEEAPQHILIALHGYGQQADYFLRPFEMLGPKNLLIFAPEGPHRFYLKGFTGRIGCSWISRYRRAWDIDEVNEQLNQLVAHIQNQFPEIPISILGFSQGGHTAYRWLHQAKFEFEQLYMWGVDFPSDELPNQPTLDDKVVFIHGEEDAFLTPERRKSFQEQCLARQLQPRIVTYTGGHQINREVLDTLF